MSIKHNVYEGGDVQSLGGEVDEGKKLPTIGILEPGHWEFGNDMEEWITVLFGEVTINGKTYGSGDTCIVPVGAGVIFDNTCRVYYSCSFH